MKKGKNALFMIPQRKEEIQWHKNGDIVILKKNRYRCIDKIMHKIFKCPQCISIELDNMGSFVWQSCDGVSNIKKISDEMCMKYGSEAEPVLERLLVYIRILVDNNLIDLT